MNLSSLSSDPNFLGKDHLSLFIGQVEDVNDPKRSGRVKVRCLGLHTRDKQSGESENSKNNYITTEDLPWSRVILPTTHAQQSRTGGKHGLLPGSWVVGFFADGLDANDPFVMGSLNFTAKASDENNREETEIDEGKLPEDQPGFTKVNVIQDNTGTHTREELVSGEDDPGDVAHDTSALDDSTDGECPIEESAHSTTKLEELKADNPHSQIYNTIVADGQCGNLMNSRAAISDAINSMLPSGVGRIIEGDKLFDINGNAINLNGILRKVSGRVSSLLKTSIQTQKANIQKTINKKTHSTGVYASASRNPITAELTDKVFSVQFDMFNSLIDRSLDQLENLVMGSLQNLNNQQRSSKENANLTGEYGTSRASIILDLESIDIADAIIMDVSVSFDDKVQRSQQESEEYCKPLYDKIDEYTLKLATTMPEDYECEEDMNLELELAVSDIENDINNSSDSGGGSGFGLGDVSQYLNMVLDMDFTINPQIFNKSGIAVLDIFTSDGCNPSDLYNTMSGYVGTIAGVSGKNTGGGSESGKSSKKKEDTYKEVGFGGVNGPSNADKTTYRPLSGDPYVKKIKQSDRKKVKDKYAEFTPVDFYEVGRTYTLQGEQVINGVTTSKSRVLVNNQLDPTENGIYITSKREWRRPVDARDPKDFKNKKRVVVKSLPELDGLYYYNGNNSPKVGYDPISFKHLFTSNDFTQAEKDAFNHFVETKPDGINANVATLSLPSSDLDGAKNFVMGIPNTTVIINPGKNYFYNNKKPNRNFPSVFIQDYVGTPVPVVDPNSGELVAVLTNYMSYGVNPDPTIAVHPDNSSIGVSTEDPNYDVYIASFFVANTGVGYGKDTEIEIIDKDREFQTALARPVIKNGRILSVEIINNGTGFRRIPKIKLKNRDGGRGAKLYPLMGLKAKESNASVKKLQQNVALAISPSTDANLFTTIDVSKL